MRLREIRLSEKGLTFQGNKTAGKKRLTPHSLRHTHASWLILAGAHLKLVMVQLGHKQITTTERYSHLYLDTRNTLTLKVFNDNFNIKQSE
jgi:integrase